MARGGGGGGGLYLGILIRKLTGVPRPAEVSDDDDMLTMTSAVGSKSVPSAPLLPIKA